MLVASWCKDKSMSKKTWVHSLVLRGSSCVTLDKSLNLLGGNGRSSFRDLFVEGSYDLYEDALKKELEKFVSIYT